jgi:hypothetical protein
MAKNSKQVWILRTKGSTGGLICNTTRDLQIGLREIGPRSEATEGDVYEIEAITLTKEEFDEIGDFDGF